jgi:hypothetical protein
LRRHLRPAVLVLAAALALGLLITRPWSGEEPPSTSGSSTGGSPFTPPDAVPDNSEYVRRRVLPSGEIRVDHWIRSSNPISGLVMRVPASAQAGTEPAEAKDVRVLSEKGAAAGPRVVRGKPVTFSFDSTPTLHVSYVLSGVVTRSSSASRRALALLTSLDLSFPHDSVPKTVMLGGGRLLAAACSVEDSTAEPRPCGNAEGRQWRVRLEPETRHDRVMAQLDLPRAEAAAEHSAG